MCRCRTHGCLRCVVVSFDAWALVLAMIFIALSGIGITTWLQLDYPQRPEFIKYYMIVACSAFVLLVASTLGITGVYTRRRLSTSLLVLSGLIFISIFVTHLTVGVLVIRSGQLNEKYLYNETGCEMIFLVNKSNETDKDKKKGRASIFNLKDNDKECCPFTDTIAYLIHNKPLLGGNHSKNGTLEYLDDKECKICIGSITAPMAKGTGILLLLNCAVLIPTVAVTIVLACRYYI